MLIISRKLVVLLAISFCGLSCQSQKNLGTGTPQNIYGKWRYVKHYWWKSSKYGIEEVQAIKSSCLTIEKDRIFFDSLIFADTCRYSEIKFRKFFNNAENKSEYSEDYQFMLIKYKIKELNLIQRIEFNCQYNCLGNLYLKQDTLILNFCGGITFYFLKEKNEIKKSKLKGNGKTGSFQNKHSEKVILGTLPKQKNDGHNMVIGSLNNKKRDELETSLQ